MSRIQKKMMYSYWKNTYWVSKILYLLPTIDWSGKM